MDKQVRELERQIAAGDPTAQDKLDQLLLRTGLTPSWECLNSKYKEAQIAIKSLLKNHLFKAIEARLHSYFEKHQNSGVEALYWGIGARPDFANWDDGYHAPNNWEIEGLCIDIDDTVWQDYCNISPCEGLDSDARTLISHLKDVCDCRPGLSINCWINHADAERPFHWLDDKQRQALLNALEDAMKIYELLNETERELVSPGNISFRYEPGKGLSAEAPKKATS
jgi:hypothetical protein